MAKQWAGWIVLSVQFVCWFAVSCLLLHRGFTNIQEKNTNQISVPYRVNVSDNYTFVEEEKTLFYPSPHYQPGRGFVAGIVMICVAVIMLVISPVFVVLKLLENRRRHRRMVKALQRDQPPRYEEVVESAPRYSTLFQFTTTGEIYVDDGKVKSEQVPLNS